jgi:hypothetical protein
MNEISLYSSIKVLITLQVMMNQDFEALIYYLKNISNDVIRNTHNGISKKEDYLDTTVIDALRFSIVLKACSFIDEWDSFLGVRNELEQKNRIELIKKSVSKARRALNQWKDLRSFRNEIIAHNFRNKNNEITIDMMGEYNCPQTISELYFLIAIIERMNSVLSACYKDIVNGIVSDFACILEKRQFYSNHFDFGDIQSKLLEIDEEISENVFTIIRYDFVSNIK